MKALCSMVFLLCCFSPRLVSAEPYQRKQIGDFVVTALVVPLPDDEFMAMRKANGGDPAEFPTQAVVSAETMIQIVVFFSGAAEENEEALVYCKTDFVLPNGSHRQMSEGYCHKGPAGGPDSIHSLAASRISFMVPPDWVGGTLVVEQTITDRVSGITLPLSVAIDVISFGAAP